jgi:methionyl-tRNA synthetase
MKNTEKPSQRKFYITTAIDYPNSKPHLGHAYEKVIADCLARWHRLKGEEVFFLTGTDEHGKKIEQAAIKSGLKPKEFVDLQVQHFKSLCKAWNISNDRFIRTTEKGHEEMCQMLFQRVMDKGDIYLGKYEGLYCTGCEAFYLEKDLIDGLCPIHKKKPEPLSEESYFFKMGKYQKKLLDYFDKNPEFIFPSRRRQEIINRIKEGLKDLSVSRTSFSWGIPLKHDKRHVIYVWFDALLNYISGIDYPSKQFDKFWPADIHVIGKDILWFHSVIWPCMLFAMDIEPPKRVFVHGFINTASGEKLSKSSGKLIDPLEISSKYGIDAIRYYLLREIPLGEDGNFSINALIERHNNELADSLGNLVYRVLSLSEKKLNSIVPDAKTDEKLSSKLDLEKISSYMEKLETHNSLAEIFSFIAECNKYINDTEPWKLNGKEAEKTLYSALDSIRIISILLWPFIPSTSEKILKQLNCKTPDKGAFLEAKFNLLQPGTKLGKKEILFKKIEAEEPEIETKDISFSVSDSLKNIGLKISAGIVEGVSIKKKHEGLEKKISAEIKKLDLSKTMNSKQVKGYYEIYNKLGVKNNKNAIYNLVEIVSTAGKLPSINTAVDSYNIVSLTKGLVVGCHDLDKISGNIKATISNGNEDFTPMGSNEKSIIPKGEYIFMDDKIVLCRMDIKQCEQTKVTNSTKNILIYVQGNENTTQEETDSALEEIFENITKYCGGKAKKIKVI